MESDRERANAERTVASARRLSLLGSGGGTS